jgi:ATP-dependent DNA helicase DinG
MSELRYLVEQAYLEGGCLAQTLPGFTPRLGQTEMALAVADTVEYGGALVVEAGTGVGKTFAYLVPALLSGERVLLSTATKTLQDQLFGRDLPRLLDALGVPVTTALLKGRASYLCLHRMGLARHDARLTDPKDLHSLAHIEQWAQVTRSGDLAELPDLDERSVLIPLVTSSRDNCLGATCPQFKACHVNLARHDALAADVVVINHHLFFADMAVRDSGVAELLPTVRVVVFDEAHQLNDVGVQFLGVTLSTGQLLDFCRDALAAGLQLARGLVDWHGLVVATESAARALRQVLGAATPSTRLCWDTYAPESVYPADWAAVWLPLRTALGGALEALDTLSEIAPDFVRLHERAGALLRQCERFAEPCPSDAVRWIDVGATGASSVRLVESPLDIAEAFKATRMASAAASERDRSWIFTSATLGTDAQLSWFTRDCGLTDALVLRVDSPFDFKAQAALYVPHDLPLPADPTHSASVAALAARAVAQLGGRTLVLTTTLKAMRVIAQALTSHFAKLGTNAGTEVEATQGGIEVLLQGQWPKRRLMERFRQGNTGGQRGCVLVASASFWEGFDVPGEALQLVIIDKLPFPPPNDPLVQARTRRLEAEGLNPFNAYFVPEAAIALKQGGGRLIRQTTDHGVLVVCDVRLAVKGYGRRIVAALPAMRRLNTEGELMLALANLQVTKTSTKPQPLT